MMSAPQGGTPAAVVNQPLAAPPTPSPDGTIGESSAGTQQSAALSAAPVAPAAAGTTAAGTTAVAVGAGVGKRKQASSIWRFMQLFVPPNSKGRNVKCIVKIKLPTSVGDVLPARTKTCGALFKHTKGDRVAGVSGSGTSGLKHHLQKHHPEEYAVMEDADRASKKVKVEKSVILASEGCAVLCNCLFMSDC